MSESVRLPRELASDPASRAARLQRFVGSVESDDAEMIAFWRERTPAEHARAGAELSDIAARVAEQRALAPVRGPMCPGLSTFIRT